MLRYALESRSGQLGLKVEVWLYKRSVGGVSRRSSLSSLHLQLLKNCSLFYDTSFTGHIESKIGEHVGRKPTA